MGIGLTPEASKGIGPATQPTTRPLNEETPCPGPLLWAADDNDRQNGAWASSNFEGKYWTQEPAATMPGPRDNQPEPTSDLTGNNPLPNGENVGDYGDPPKVVPYIDTGAGDMSFAARPDINNVS